jgi:FtsZ-interacting cell division protein ZipA
MISNNIIWIISGIILIVMLLVIIIIFSRKNKKQPKCYNEQIPITHQKNYKEDSNYPSKLEQESASNETENYKEQVKITKFTDEEYYLPEEY